MHFQVLSDLHCEWFPTNYDKLLSSLALPNVDGVIIAGDLGSVKYLPAALSSACKLWKKVIFVAGNHEYYHIGVKIHEDLDKLCKKHKNLRWLHDNYVKFDNVWIYGTTLWFMDDPLNCVYSRYMNDFRVIPNINNFLYKNNKLAMTGLNLFLRKQERDNSDKIIIVTHHAPSEKSVGEEYKNSKINRFFVCDMTPLIVETSPTFWIHGHMHGFFRYNIRNTEIICNPRGYPDGVDDLNNKYIENPNFQENLVIEV